jgi:hypothetical protein
MRRKKIIFIFFSFILFPTFAFNKNTFFIDSSRLINQAKILKPVFCSSKLCRISSYKKFLEKLKAIAFYYDEIVEIYKQDQLPEQKRTIELINKLFLKIMICSREFVKQNQNMDPATTIHNLQQQQLQEQMLQNLILASNQAQETFDELTRPSREKRLKIIAYCVGISIVLIIVGIFAYKIYKKVANVYFEATRLGDEEIERLEDMEEMGKGMKEDLRYIDKRLKTTKENTAGVKSAYKKIGDKVEAARDEVRKIRKKYDKKVDELKFQTEIMQTLDQYREEINRLREILNQQEGEKNISRQNEFTIVTLMRKQRRKMRKLERRIEDLREKLRRNEERIKTVEERTDLRFDTELALSQQAIENKYEIKDAKRDIEKIKEKMDKLRDSFSEGSLNGMEENGEGDVSPEKKDTKKKDTKGKKK